MSNAVIPMADVMKMAQAVASSGLFGVKDANQAMALMLVAQAEGRHPALAARDYDIIQGRPAKKTEAMLRDFLENQGKVEWHQLDDAMASATFSHPSGGSVRIDWDMGRAKAAGLATRDMWRKYPRQMLRSRCVSEGIRTVCPMATSGMYVPEEIRDIGPEKDITPDPITPKSGAKERLSRGQQDKVDAVAVACQEHLDNGSAEDAAVELDNAALDADEMVYFWTQFDAKAGKAIAEAGKALRKARKAATLPPAAPEPAPASETITPAQHKRLEARIKELGADRDKLKAYVMKEYGIEHLNHLTKDAYNAVDEILDAKAKKAERAAVEKDIPDRIAACQTAEELDALAETLSEDDAAIFFDAFAKRKSELTEGGGL